LSETFTSEFDPNRSVGSSRPRERRLGWLVFSGCGHAVLELTRTVGNRVSPVKVPTVR
jgi:hypothetical protein